MSFYFTANPEKGSAIGEPFSGLEREGSVGYPELSLRSNSGLKLANAFGVRSREAQKAPRKTA